jgi:hypothetical protein
MKDKYDKYWGNWHEPLGETGTNVNERGKGKEKEKENMNMLIFVAATLDPRYKLSEYTKQAIEEMFSEENDIRFGLLLNHVFDNCLKNIGDFMLHLMQQHQPMILKK